jgi:S1-C subfamily serine protease
LTGLDIGIIGFALLLAILGYQQGLIVGAITLAGFAGGAIAGARIGPALLEGGSDSPYAALTALLGGLILGAMLALIAEGLARLLRARLVRGGVTGAMDGIGGALLLAALALGLAWVFGAVALNTPGLGDVRDAVQRSEILKRLNAALPPTGPLLNVLNRVDPRPEVTGPQASVPPPDSEIARDPDVRAAGESVVRVLGTACGLGISGSGWVAEPETVITNAHVVAGEDDTSVQTMTGSELDATAVHYDPRNDLAILRVAGLEQPPLGSVGDPEAGTEAAVLGYPENGPFTISPARLGETGEVLSQDSYGRGPVRREMTPFRGEVQPGSSGGPAVDGDGAVLTTVFAASTSGRQDTGLGVPNDIVSRALERLGGPVSTGPCAA